MKTTKKQAMVVISVMLITALISISLNITFNKDSFYNLPEILLIACLAVMLIGCDYAATADLGYYDLYTLDNLPYILGQNGYKVTSRWGNDVELNFYIIQHRENIKHRKLQNFITALMCYLIPSVILNAEIGIKEFFIITILFSLIYMMPVHEVFPSKKQKEIHPVEGLERHLPYNYERLDDEDRYYKRIDAYTNLKAEYCDMLRLKNPTESWSDLISMILPGFTLYGGVVFLWIAFAYNAILSSGVFCAVFSILNVLYIFF